MKKEHLNKINPEKLAEEFFAEYLNFFRSKGISDEDADNLLKKLLVKNISDEKLNFDDIKTANIEDFDPLIDLWEKEKIIDKEQSNFYHNNKNDILNLIQRFLPVFVKKIQEGVSLNRLTFGFPSHPIP